MNPEQKSIAIVILITVAGFAAMALFGYFIYISSDVQETGNETKVAAQLQTFQRLAENYYKQLGFYEGFCGDAALPERYQCDADETGVRVYTAISQGYYCTDTTGFTGVVRPTPRGQVVCE